MADFVKVNDALGKLTEGNAIDKSAGAGDGDKIVKTQNDGTLSPSLMPPGIGADMLELTSSEAISAPAFVRVDSNMFVANADASLANGSGACVAFVKDAIADGAAGNVYFEGISTGWSGLTIGAMCFLSETAGQVTQTPVTASGHLLQPVGVAISDTQISFEPGQGVIRG